jgi:hypothetical protein
MTGPNFDFFDGSTSDVYSSANRMTFEFTTPDLLAANLTYDRDSFDTDRFNVDFTSWSMSDGRVTLDASNGMLNTFLFATNGEGKITGFNVAANQFPISFDPNYAIMEAVSSCQPFANSCLPGDYLKHATLLQFGFGLVGATASAGATTWSLLGSDEPANVAEFVPPRPPSPHVPEPSTWALLILGFGVSGSQLRRQRAASPRM